LIALNWAKRYAPADMRIEVRKKLTPDIVSSLSENEKKAILSLVEKMKKDITEKDLQSAVKAILSLVEKMKKDITEKDLQSAVYDIARENNLQPRDFFKLMYKLILGKESGPRLGPFIVTIGKERVIKLLEGIKQ